MKIYGNINLNGKFFKGTVTIEDGIITSVKERKENYDVKGTVIPTFINMHTHLGDYYYGEEINGTLREVVGPGGLKFSILKNREASIRGMQKALKYMELCGTSHFVDFREGGRDGVIMLRDALKNRKIRGIILGREGLWKEADGVGMSSLSDVDIDKYSMLAKSAKSKGKIFAMHFSEDRRENVEKAISLNPNFIVHALKATDEDLKKIKDAKIPIVLTPRANAFWGHTPNIPHLLSLGLKVALGTDNGMIAAPCMFREMEFAYRISRVYEKVRAEDILKMATTIPREIIGIRDNKMGEKASLIIFKDILTPYEIVTRSSCMEIRKVII